MSLRARLWVLLAGETARFGVATLVGSLAGSAGCAGSDEGTDGDPVSRADGGAQTLDGAAADGGSAIPYPDAAAVDGSSGPSVDGGPRIDAGPTTPMLNLTIPVSSVRCAGSDCATLDNVCCSSWTQGSGFGSAESCLTRKACYDQFERAGTTNRAVTRECDGKEDCSAGQICCVYADGMPLFSDLFNPVDLQGPGGSTICADEVDCTYNNTSTFISNGIPLGEIECNDNSDCEDRAGTSCQAELNDSHSTGKGVSARASVKVCR